VVDATVPSVGDSATASGSTSSSRVTTGGATGTSSAALVLEDLGEDSAATALREAVEAHLAVPDAPRTPDLGGSAGTESVADSVRARL